MAAVIETNKLTKKYDGRAVVDQLTFTVPQGSIFGFLGPNGAGKTTTFAMLCGFIRPSGGDAVVLGQPLSNLPRHLMSALPQDAKFHPERTLKDSLIFMAQLQGMDKRKAAAEAKRVLEAVELLDAAKFRGKTLSHGMAKRFGVAQAFLGTPELVLLDEPTEGLDPKNSQTVRDMIKAMAGKSTVLVSSHNLAEIEDLCNEALILDKGKLVTQASISELTGRNQQILIQLGSAGSIDALKNLSSVIAVEASDDGKSLRVSLNLAPGERPEPAITEILSTLISTGATVGTVVRGKSLQERFLELT